MFLDREGGGYFNTPGEDPSVLLRVKEDHDGAEPSGNSVSAINLVRLASMMTGSKSEYYRQNAEHLLVCCCFTHKRFSGEISVYNSSSHCVSITNSSRGDAGSF